MRLLLDWQDAVEAVRGAELYRTVMALNATIFVAFGVFFRVEGFAFALLALAGGSYVQFVEIPRLRARQAAVWARMTSGRDE